MKVTFNHGKDPQLGDKVLGIPTVLERRRLTACATRCRSSTPHTTASSHPGCKAGAYGSSFRFNVAADEFNKTREAVGVQPQRTARADGERSAHAGVRPGHVSRL